MIIDASVALKWLVIEEHSDQARLLMTRVDLAGPGLLHSEVANGLRKKQRRGELDADVDLEGLMGTLSGLIQTIDEVFVMGRAVRLSIKLNHSVYDCVYLALAEQLDRELVTADLKFLTKVAATELAPLARGL